MKVNIYESEKLIGTEELENVLNGIKEGKYEAEVNQLRDSIQAGSDEKMKELTMFTPAGIVKPISEREVDNDYTGLVTLRYEFSSIEDLDNIRVQLKRVDHVYAYFLSADAKSIVILVQSSFTDPFSHSYVYPDIKEAIERRINVELEDGYSGNNYKCAVSFDNEAYLNPDPHTLSVTFLAINIVIKEIDDGGKEHDSFDEFIEEIADKSYRRGFPVDKVFRTLIIYYANSIDEANKIEGTVRSAYEKLKDEGVHQEVFEDIALYMPKEEEDGKKLVDHSKITSKYMFAEDKVLGEKRTLEEFLDWVKNGKSQATPEAEELEIFPLIAFLHEEDEFVGICYTGMFVHNFGPFKVNDLEAKKKEFAKLPFTRAVYIGPTGTDLVVISCNDPGIDPNYKDEQEKAYRKSLMIHLSAVSDLQDKNLKNHLGLMAKLSHDPDVYDNPEAGGVQIVGHGEIARL